MIISYSKFLSVGLDSFVVLSKINYICIDNSCQGNESVANNKTLKPNLLT